MDNKMFTKRFLKAFVDKTGHEEAQTLEIYRRRAPDAESKTAP